MKTVFINCSPKKRFCASAYFLFLQRAFVGGEKITEKLRTPADHKRILAQLKGAPTLEQVRAAYADFYAGQKLIHVATAEESAAYGKLYGNARAGRDSLEIVVAGNDAQCTVTAVFDNLGKGASGAAIQNMNLVLGLEPTTGLVL